MRAVPRVKTLAEIECIEITCSDCGRSRRWTQADIEGRGLPGEATINDLGNKLYCQTCKSRGGHGVNVEIRDVPLGAGLRRFG